MSGGTKFTKECCERHQKAYLVVDLAVADTWNQKKMTEWITKTQPHALNIAGPRESKYPGIHERSKTLLEKVFKIVFNESPLLKK